MSSILDMFALGCLCNIQRDLLNSSRICRTDRRKIWNSGIDVGIIGMR